MAQTWALRSVSFIPCGNRRRGGFGLRVRAVQGQRAKRAGAASPRPRCRTRRAPATSSPLCDVRARLTPPRPHRPSGRRTRPNWRGRARPRPTPGRQAAGGSGVPPRPLGSSHRPGLERVAQSSPQHGASVTTTVNPSVQRRLLVSTKMQAERPSLMFPRRPVAPLRSIAQRVGIALHSGPLRGGARLCREARAGVEGALGVHTKGQLV